MKIVLKQVTLLHPDQKLNEKNDLLIEDGVIKKIGGVTESEIKSSRVLELENKFCSPGFFDMHVHLREPGREDEETVQTGCNAASRRRFYRRCMHAEYKSGYRLCGSSPVYKRESSKSFSGCLPGCSRNIRKKRRSNFSNAGIA